MVLKVVIPGEPCSQGRPRFARRGRFVMAYDPPKSRNWKATAQQHMRDEMDDDAPLQGPLQVIVQALFTCPLSDHRKSMSRHRRWHAKRPDAENVAKAVLDAGTGVIWRDDSQIARLVVAKHIAAQDEAPGVIVSVATLEDEP